MQNENKPILELNDSPRLSQTLSVLTILSLIWSAIQFVLGIFNYFNICKQVQETAEAAKALDNKFFDSLKESAQLQCENKLIITIITLLTALLCAYGAFQMRKLKKIGLPIYAVGELIAPIALIFILGASTMNLVGLIIPVIFVALYFSRQKELVY